MSTSENATPVQRLYAFAGGGWWLPFRAVWTACTSRAAERELDALFRRYVQPSSNILDLGCGTGINRLRLKRLGLEFATYRGMDFSPHMLRRAERCVPDDPRTTFELRDAATLGETGGQYDLIVTTWMLSHLKDRPAMVQTALQRLAPEGHLLWLDFSAGSWLARAVMGPIGRAILQTDPIRPDEERRFGGRGRLSRYFFGAVTLMDMTGGDAAQ